MYQLPVFINTLKSIAKSKYGVIFWEQAANTNHLAPLGETKAF